MASHLPANDDIVEVNEPLHRSPVHKLASTWLYLMLGGVLTAFIWKGMQPVPETMPGGILTGLVWAMVLIGICSRAQARRLSVELEAARAFEQSIIAHRGGSGTPETSEAARLRHVSAWLVFIMGLTGAGLLWYFDHFQAWLGESTTLVVGATIASMLALTTAANTLNRLKARRLAREFRSQRDSEQATLDTLRSLDVMITACLPSGERTEFNNRFLEFVGRPFEELQGRGWLDIVRPDDRQRVLNEVQRSLAKNETKRTLEYGLLQRNGQELWVRETLTPRTDDKGHLIEFIGAVFDVTKQRESDQAHTEAEALQRDHLAKLKDELSKTKTSRNRFQKNLEEARADVKNLSEIVESAEARITEAEADSKKGIDKIESAVQGRLEKLQSDLKISKGEQKAAQAENRKLTSAFEKMKNEIAEFRKQEGALRDQIAKHISEMREASADAADARKEEAKQRAKTNDYAKKCDALEAQLGGKSENDRKLQTELERALAERDQQLNEARTNMEQLGKEMADQAAQCEREVSPTRLADQLRRQLEGLAKMNETLNGASLQGPHREALSNATAAVVAMQNLVDQALGKDVGEIIVRTNTGSSFDVRQTMQGVQEFIEGDASSRGLSVNIEVGKNVPGLVHGDDIALRTALLSLTNAALSLIQEGALHVRLSEDLSTDAHTTLRCEFSHSGAKINPEDVESGLALNSTDEDLPNAVKFPVRHQAGQAWRIIRCMEGNHGFMLPDQGGFSVWCTFNVGRVGAAAAVQSANTVEMTPVPIESELPETIPVATEPIPKVTMPMAPLPTPPASSAPSAPPAPPAPPVSSYQSTPIAPPAHLSGDLSKMPRLPQEFLKCSLGEVVELGVSGMRVYAPRPPKTDTLKVKIESLSLEAEVEWSKKMGGRKHDVGLAFLNLTQEQQKKILGIAMSHRRISNMLDRD